jgi:small subunit ribosomal protein S13
MAEDKKQKQEKQEKPQKQPEQVKESKRPQELSNETLIRILGFDIPGSKCLYPGLTRIKGVSWTISNIICLKTGISRNKRILELSKPEIQKIESVLQNLEIPDYQKNRRNDVETGKTTHLFGSDLDVAKDFDIKRQKKMKSYVGIRHAAGQPVRGQRTRSHFRKKKVQKVGKKATMTTTKVGGKASK